MSHVHMRVKAGGEKKGGIIGTLRVSRTNVISDDLCSLAQAATAE